MRRPKRRTTTVVQIQPSATVVDILKRRLIESARTEEGDHSPVWTADDERRFQTQFGRPSPHANKVIPIT